MKKHTQQRKAKTSSTNRHNNLMKPKTPEAKIHNVNTLCKSVSIIRNYLNSEHVVSRKAWHASICNYNIPAADILSIIIDLYDEFPNQVSDGEICVDEDYLNYCLWNDPDGGHGYGALLRYLESLGLISFRRCYDPKFQHAASGRMYYIRLGVSEIEQWLEEDGSEVEVHTL